MRKLIENIAWKRFLSSSAFIIPNHGGNAIVNFDENFPIKTKNSALSQKNESAEKSVAIYLYFTIFSIENVFMLKMGPNPGFPLQNGLRSGPGYQSCRRGENQGGNRGIPGQWRPPEERGSGPDSVRPEQY